MKSYAEQAVDAAVQMIDLKGTSNHAKFSIIGRRYDEIVRRRPSAAWVFEESA